MCVLCLNTLGERHLAVKQVYLLRDLVNMLWCALRLRGSVCKSISIQYPSRRSDEEHLLLGMGFVESGTEENAKIPFLK